MYLAASHISEPCDYILSVGGREIFAPLMLQWEFVHGLFNSVCGPSLFWRSLEHTVPTAPYLSLTPPTSVVTSHSPGDNKQPLFSLSLCILHHVTIPAISVSR